MPDLFGYVGGERQADMDRASLQLNDLASQKGAIEVESAKMVLAQQKKMQQLLEGNGAVKTIDDLATSLDKMAGAAAGAGMIDDARQLASTASTMRHNDADIETKKLSNTIKQLNLYSGLLADVDSEESWKQANAMYKMQTQQDAPYAHVPYSPELVGRLQTSTMTMKDRIAAQANIARQKASEAAAATNRARIPLIEAQAELARTRKRALEKSGVVAKPPKDSELKAVTDIINSKYRTSLTPEDARIYGRPVAERMLEIMADEGLPQSAAAQQAVAEAEAAGKLTGLRTVRPGAGSRNKPLKMPSGWEKDRTKLQRNLYYDFQGQTYLWTGTGLLPADEVEEEEESEDGEELEE